LGVIHYRVGIGLAFLFLFIEICLKFFNLLVEILFGTDLSFKGTVQFNPGQVNIFLGHKTQGLVGIDHYAIIFLAMIWDDVIIDGGGAYGIENIAGLLIVIFKHILGFIQICDTLLVIELRPFGGGGLKRPEEVIAGWIFALADFFLSELRGTIIVGRLKMRVKSGQGGFCRVTAGQ
jgi:hypothetical protein